MSDKPTVVTEKKGLLSEKEAKYKSMLFLEKNQPQIEQKKMKLTFIGFPASKC